MVAVVTNEGKFVMRPPHVLVPLIKEDLKRGDKVTEEAIKTAKNAGLPYYQAAGEKMLEAKGQMKHGEFSDWVKKNFRCSVRNAQLYMSFAIAAADPQKRIEIQKQEDLSFQEAIREFTSNTSHGKAAKWRAEMEENIRRARDQAKRLEHENLTRQQEREAEKKLALQLISIGFKALASKLHPDKGGTKDAMSRLSRVRDRLKSVYA